MVWWDDFTYLLAHNVYFQSGFFWGLGVVAAGWFAWSTLHYLYVHWLKIRKFFEPTKVPGKTPTETGPSPASMMLGCFGRILFALLVVSAVVGYLWIANLPGR
jgi:hypothetical protein